MRHQAIKKVLGRLIKDFENNHRFQLRFHLIAMLFWMANFVVGTIIVFCWPHLWLEIGVYYVFSLSIYANWDTDYDAVSASQAAMHSEDLLNQKLREIENVCPAGDLLPGPETED